MTRLFPDVRAGDRITGVHRPGTGARFFVNGRLQGELPDADFARLFFGIWLSPRTSEPALREALLGPGAAMTALAAPRGWQGGWAQGLSYGGLGLPLAFVALPLYVILPNHYASEFGIPLATLGALLLVARLLDAVADPWIGRLVDGWFAHSVARVLGVAAIAALVLAAGFRGLFFPAVAGHHGLAGLVRGAAGRDLPQLQRAVGHPPGLGRTTGRRRGPARAHRLLARRPGAAGRAGGQRAAFGGRPVGGQRGFRRRPGGGAGAAGARAAAGVPCPRGAARRISWRRCRHPGFRRLLAIFLVNGVASAVPATLVLFFIRDRLQAPAFEPLFLASYFAAGALSMPLWVRAVARFGLARAWAGRHGAGHRHLRLGGAAGQRRRGWPTPPSAWPAALRSAPTSRCPARCWPASSSVPATASGWKAPISAGGISPPSSTWRWPPASRCRCSAPSATRRAASDAEALQRADHRLLPAALRAQARGRGAALDPVDPQERRPMKRRLTLALAAVALAAAVLGRLRRPDTGRLRGREAGARPEDLLQRRPRRARHLHRPLGQGRAPLRRCR